MIWSGGQLLGGSGMWGAGRTGRDCTHADPNRSNNPWSHQKFKKSLEAPQSYKMSRFNTKNIFKGTSCCWKPYSGQRGRRIAPTQIQIDRYKPWSHPAALKATQVSSNQNRSWGAGLCHLWILWQNLIGKACLTLQSCPFTIFARSSPMKKLHNMLKQLSAERAKLFNLQITVFMLYDVRRTYDIIV